MQSISRVFFSSIDKTLQSTCDALTKLSVKCWFMQYSCNWGWQTRFEFDEIGCKKMNMIGQQKLEMNDQSGNWLRDVLDLEFWDQIKWKKYEIEWKKCQNGQ